MKTKIFQFIDKLISETKSGKLVWKTDGQDTTFFLDGVLMEEIKVKLVLVSYQTGTPVFSLLIMRKNSQLMLNKIFPGTKLHATLLELYDTLYMKQIQKGIKLIETDGKPDEDGINIMSAFEFIDKKED